MLLWHVAAVVFLFRWIFRDPGVDHRFLVIGAIAPDLVDRGLAAMLGLEVVEAWSHTLLGPTLLAIVVLVVTRRGERRKAWMALVVAVFFHLLIDGVWRDGALFGWPLLGTEFVPRFDGSWGAAVERAFSDPWRWVREAVGLVYLLSIRAGRPGSHAAETAG